MILLIGLGNPGAAYQYTRHNAGFEVIDRLSLRWEIPVIRSRCKGLVGEGRFAEERVALIKPETYMNLSGECVQAAMQWYKVPPDQTLIISDDIDLPLGKLRIRAKGGAGTHRGWQSILQMTGSEQFPRIRVGVGAPPPEWDLKDWVLARFHPGEEWEAMDDCFEAACDACESFIKSGINRTMNLFNKK